MKNTKQCTQCKQIKDFSEYGKQKIAKDGLRAACVVCDRERSKKYKRSKNGIISKIYNHQRESSKKRGHRPPEYSKESLSDWLYSQELFHKLFEEWKQSGYKTRLKPSVDRKNDDIHYCMNNIQLMTWGENDEKAKRDHKSGRLKYDQKPVEQYTRNGEFRECYDSINEAERKTGVPSGNIVKACIGHKHYSHAGGYVWKYK